MEKVIHPDRARATQTPKQVVNNNNNIYNIYNNNNNLRYFLSTMFLVRIHPNEPNGWVNPM
jgi:hypothetical protein